ncbi:DUF2283 domain-containing protein [Candidatus Nitrososphaera sp. FF02]|uniref:DUF2283 domain-containing protein n=1 Tax=Candidatus Nitrososphaera sp. FF02 TaxID=3398226 RepID=UPI0039E7E8C3
MASVTYDPDAKALYIELKDGKKVSKTIPAGNDRYFDLDEDGKVIGVEILFAQDMPQDLIDAILQTKQQIAVLN